MPVVSPSLLAQSHLLLPSHSQRRSSSRKPKEALKVGLFCSRFVIRDVFFWSTPRKKMKKLGQYLDPFRVGFSLHFEGYPDGPVGGKCRWFFSESTKAGKMLISTLFSSEWPNPPDTIQKRGKTPLYCVFLASMATNRHMDHLLVLLDMWTQLKAVMLVESSTRVSHSP